MNKLISCQRNDLPGKLLRCATVVGCLGHIGNRGNLPGAALTYTVQDRN